MLQQRVKESIGFWPDGYIMVNLDSFVDLAGYAACAGEIATKEV